MVKRVFFCPLWNQELVLCAVVGSRIQVIGQIRLIDVDGYRVGKNRTN